MGYGATRNLSWSAFSRPTRPARRQNLQAAILAAKDFHQGGDMQFSKLSAILLFGTACAVAAAQKADPAKAKDQKVVNAPSTAPVIVF